METDFSRLQKSYFSGSECTGYIYQNEHKDESGVLGYDTASYLRRILSGVVTLHHIPAVQGYDAASYPRTLLSWVMMLHNVLEEFYPVLCCIMS